MKKNFISNSRESIRMFKNPLFEALSKVPYYVPLIVFIPIISYFLWTAVVAYGVLALLLNLVMGLIAWTLVEYIMHRWVFHFYPSSNWGKRIHFIFHGVHHDYPNDAQRLVLPPSASIPLATAFYFLFRWLLPFDMLNGFFGGFLLGYLFYDITHYMLHHAQFKNGLWKKIKHHHMLHHYDDSTKGYGVTSALWDKIFGSDFLKK
ncbi:Fatty acid hydroxylase superfamily protein [compost metagenome]|uniref:sterol desaturase family protein n=1 Tax=Pedobacter sp. ok626 TaxID=1761882 RepID=UPI00088FDB69|nr:sterol desaturase family protein [Pedobacter sp. ok626]SDK11655.1 Fatty acid hydroxylase superfamily protein [Pedobacter sp. ok626]